ncbi:hypothetical protein [Pseudomonas baetica]|uniref:hypothetical protein n=1 Tax=Pseudomonas baetica TaxID=674054 RepID=UPI002404A360|nr:hypothetical protein [Pseudomonas baetica]MDF9778835.1 type IV secretory pathway VirB10-like protein [Pseudomonas baetica]
MANEANQNGDNVEQSGMPTRVLRIDGERTGRLFTNAIRVGRIDKRLRELSLSTNADSRRQFRLGDEGFSKAIGDFENALDQIEKDLAFTSRSSRNNQEGQGSQTAKRQAPKGKPAPQRVVAGVVQPKAASVTPSAPAAPAKPQAPAKKPQPQTQAPAVAVAPATATAPAPAQAQAPAGKKRKKRKKAKPNVDQTQASASAAQNATGGQQPAPKGDAKQTSAKVAPDAAKTADQGKNPNDAQQPKPAAEKKPAATPALS